MLNRTVICRSALVLSTIFGATACGDQDKVTYKSGEMTHTWVEGKAAVPKEFERLVYPDASTTGSVSAEGDSDEQSKFLMLTSNASADTVSDWYQDQLKKADWKVDKVDPVTETPKLVSISAHKEDLELNVMVSEEGSKTTISLSAGKSLENASQNKEEPPENYTPDKVTPPTD